MIKTSDAPNRLKVIVQALKKPTHAQNLQYTLIKQSGSYDAVCM